METEGRLYAGVEVTFFYGLCKLQAGQMTMGVGSWELEGGCSDETLLGKFWSYGPEKRDSCEMTNEG